MAIEKKFFHDKSVLLLLTTNAILVFFSIAMILIRMTSSRTGIYIVQRRANLGIDQYTQGGVSTIIGFIVFSLLILVSSTFLSIKSYETKKYLTFVILSLATLLLICNFIVSSSLLAKH